MCELKSTLVGGFKIDRINDANDHRDHAGILVLQHLPCAAAFIEHQNGIANAGMGVIERDEITAVIIRFQAKGLNHKQSAVFVICMAYGGYDCSNNFCDDHKIM